jgi:peroxiredoxin
MTRWCLRRSIAWPLPLAAWLCLLLVVLGPSVPSLLPVRAEGTQPTLSPEEKRIAGQIHGLRSLPNDVRAHVTKQLALQIRGLRASDNKVGLANDLANLSTEGDFGHDTVQEVATTLADALGERPVPADKGQPATPYTELAELVHFEQVTVSLDNPQFAAAKAKTEADDALRDRANFTLTDLYGKQWTLKDLRGKVVLVNFWATWCPPCRKEMPDLETLYNRFKGRGLVILAISDEEASKVGPFITERDITYPVLLDRGRRVNTLFQIDGIPKSFVYNRSGNLVSQSMDMRTLKQFLGMLAQAGLN